MGFWTRVRLPSSPLKRNNPQTSMSGAFAPDIIHDNRMLAERVFYCFYHIGNFHFFFITSFGYEFMNAKPIVALHWIYRYAKIL